MAPHAAATAGPVGSVSGHGSAGTARPGYVGDNKQTHPCPRPTRCAAVPGPGGGAAGPPAAPSGRSAPAQPRTGSGGSRPGAGAQPGSQGRYPVASSRRRVCGGRPGSAPLPSAAPGPAPSPPQPHVPHAAPTAVLPAADICAVIAPLRAVPSPLQWEQLHSIILHHTVDKKDGI